MMIAWKMWVAALCLLSAAPSAFGLVACPKGVSAFESTVHALLRKDCIDCHDTGGRGPAHSVASAETSYARILGYVNWSDMDRSKLVVKGGSRHCLEYPGGKCSSTYDDMKRVLREWWEAGQKDCPTTGALVTRAVAVPKTGGGGFATMRWELDALDPKFRLAFVEMEVARFMRAGAAQPQYLFRKPRLAAPVRPLRIEGIQFLVNGKLDPLASALTLIAATISPAGMPPEPPAVLPYPMLSTASLLVSRDRGDEDEISLALDVVKVAPAVECRAVEAFRANVLPAFQARRCYQCHGGGPESLPGRPPASQVFSMALDEAALCSSALQRASGPLAIDSPLISFPLRGAFDHPRMFAGSGEVLPGWIEWIEAERRLAAHPRTGPVSRRRK